MVLARNLDISSVARTTLRTRQFSSSASKRYDYRRPQAAQVQGRSILRVQGKDAAKFLKGLTCKDVEGLPGGGYSGFINPTVSRVVWRPRDVTLLQVLLGKSNARCLYLSPIINRYILDRPLYRRIRLDGVNAQHKSPI